MPTTCKVCRTESCVLLLDLSVRFAQHLNQGGKKTVGVAVKKLNYNKKSISFIERKSQAETTLAIIL
jgi:hypothetical protein